MALPERTVTRSRGRLVVAYEKGDYNERHRTYSLWGRGQAWDHLEANPPNDAPLRASNVRGNPWRRLHTDTHWCWYAVIGVNDT